MPHLFFMEGNMTAPKGTAPFTTEESKAAEAKHTSLIAEILKQKPEINTQKSLSIEALCEGKNPYSLDKRGRSQKWQADGGWIYINGELAGVAECKYQDSRQNACERAFRYLTVDRFRLEPHRIFFSCYGPGFTQENGGGSTGPFLDMASQAGIAVLENPTDKTFKIKFETWLRRLLKDAR
tara:strand:+ start:38 stop:580 length:543 start_codon:yes stop_codon:yes gene_type:complete